MLSSSFQGGTFFWEKKFKKSVSEEKDEDADADVIQICIQRRNFRNPWIGDDEHFFSGNTYSTRGVRVKQDPFNKI